MLDQSSKQRAPKEKMTTRKIMVGTLGVLLSLGGLYYAFHNVKLADLWEATSRIRFFPLILSIVAYWAGVVVARAFLVQYLLKRLGTVKWTRAYRCLSIGFLANNVLPFRMGDLARSAAMARGAQIPFSSVVGSLALERLLDMVMVAVIGLMALQVAPLPVELRTFITWSGVVLGIGLAILILIARSSQDKNIFGKSAMGRLIWGLWLKFSAGFASLKDFRGLGTIILLEAILWACALASFSFKLAAFDLPAGIDHSLVLLTCLGAAVALPSAPGYVGVYHAAATIAVSQMAGVDNSIAVAFGLFSWVIDIACGNIIGMLGMIFEGMTFGDLKKVGELSEDAAN